MMTTVKNGLEIAVVGMACKFPGAKNINEFWKNLMDGKESIKNFSNDELRALGVSEELLSNSNYVKANGLIDDEETFDSDFFNYTPEEAKIMHPQGRKLLECVYEALENAGYNPYKYKGEIGLYAGTGSSTMWEANVVYNNKSQVLGKFSSSFLSDKDYIITNISYKLNLRGPSISVKSACSTSLVSIHLACRAILTGDCDMAVAGGSTIGFGNRNGYLYEDGSVYSKDGHCRAFDKEATGTVPSDGVGVVVLKSLDSAIEDGDHIYAIIKGSAINGDGNDKVGYTAPSVEGEARVIKACLNIADVEASTIDYIEAHGTGTALGDAVEMEALKMAYSGVAPGSCAIGSVKSNIGHLDSASGVSGVIKAILCLYHKKLVPSLYFNEPNPRINISNTPFWINTQLRDWEKKDHPRRGAVSSFGIGGTNAHIILEEFIPNNAYISQESEQILLFSAKNRDGLDRSIENFIDYSQENNPYSLQDIAYTLQVGRGFYKSRAFTIAESKEEAVGNLKDPDKNRTFYYDTTYNSREFIFMFPGQGIQYENIGKELYECFEPFRIEMNHCFEILEKYKYGNIKRILYPKSDGYNPIVGNADVSSIINFIIEYSLAKSLISIGIKPSYMVGHSIGEYACACIAGIVSLEDTIKLVSYRGKLMDSLPVGKMMSVPLSYNEIRELIKNKKIFIAADHGYSCLVSGSPEDIHAFCKELMQKRLICQELDICIAGHSSIMNTISAKYKLILEKIHFMDAQIPIVSSVTGNLVSDEMKSQEYWISQMTNTVMFADAINKIMDIGKENLFLELGAGNVLCRIVNQLRGSGKEIVAFNLFKYRGQKISDTRYLMEKIGLLWLHGGKVDWDIFNYGTEKKRVPVCTYPFEKRLFPYKNDKLNLNSIQEQEKGKRREFKHWYYLPVWKRKLLSRESIDTRLQYVAFFVEEGETYNVLLELVKQQTYKPIWIMRSNIYLQQDETHYTIDPSDSEQYKLVLSSLSKLNILPDKFVFFWGLKEDCDEGRTIDIDSAHKAQEIGFISIMSLAKTVGRVSNHKKFEFIYVSNDAQKVNQYKVLYPELATVFGAIKIIPSEYSNIKCRSIDISMRQINNTKLNKNVKNILEEITRVNVNEFIVYRDDIRFVRGYDPIELENIDENSKLFDNNKVYIIVGGFGAIGYNLTQYISNNVHNTTLIILQRSKVSQNNKQLDKLQINGNTVEVYSVDISKEVNLKNTFESIYLRHKAVNGVLFCAGVNDGSLICNFDSEMLDKTFSAKIYGSILVNQYIKKEDLDFYFFCSSFNVLLNSIGTIGYTSANMFVDAFANYLNDNFSIETKCINWFAWKQVGGAVKNIQKIINTSVNRRINQVSDYPDIKKLFETKDQAVYATSINSSTSWVVNEHKLMNRALVPGTAYIDMIALIVNQFYELHCFKLSDIYYMKLLYINKSETKILRISVEKINMIEYEFMIQSKNSTEEDSWETHVKGKFSGEIEEKAKINVREKLNIIRAKSSKPEIAVNNLKERNVFLGDRWLTSVKKSVVGENEGAILIELQHNYVDDMDKHFLHPALFDLALATISLNDTLYLPFYFKNINVYDKLPSKITSFVKSNVSDEGVISYSYQVVDEFGKVILDIDDYTLINTVLIKSNECSQQINIQDDMKLQECNIIDKSLKNGLSPTEGVQVFKNIMNSELVQVIVCPMDLYSQLHSKEESDFLLNDKNDEMNLNKERELSTVYVEPKEVIEKQIADIWKRVLGIKEVGLNDNYFDLGANSLSIIQVNRLVQNVLEREISIVSYYVNPTIREFVNFIIGSNKDEEQDTIISKPKNGRDKLKRRRNVLK